MSPYKDLLSLHTMPFAEEESQEAASCTQPPQGPRVKMHCAHQSDVIPKLVWLLRLTLCGSLPFLQRVQKSLCNRSPPFDDCQELLTVL